MKNQDEKTSAPRKRALLDDDEDQDLEIVDAGRDISDRLKPGYSWINHFKNMHPGWEFARFDAIPWTPLSKRLTECRLGYISLAGVYKKGQKPFSVAPGAVSDTLRRQRFKTPGDWSYREIPYDEDVAELTVAPGYYDHSEADEDINCVFPIERLLELQYGNVIASLAENHFSLMGYVPEWKLIESGAAKEIGDKLEAGNVDAVFLSPSCVLAHQNMAVIQRHLEERGLPTLSLTLCPDVIEQIGVPRAVCLRFPLGNVFGAASDEMTQYRILKDALTAFEEIDEPGSILTLPYEWSQEY